MGTQNNIIRYALKNYKTIDQEIGDITGNTASEVWRCLYNQAKFNAPKEIMAKFQTFITEQTQGDGIDSKLKKKALRSIAVGYGVILMSPIRFKDVRDVVFNRLLPSNPWAEWAWNETHARLEYHHIKSDRDYSSEQQAFFKELESFDRHYGFSDSLTVYRKGQAVHNRLIDEAKRLDLVEEFSTFMKN